MTTDTPVLIDLELDAWLGEHLFGLSVEWDYWFAGSDGAKRAGQANNRGQTPFEVGEFDALPCYSSTYEGMGLVLEAMRQRGWTWILSTISHLDSHAGQLRAQMFNEQASVDAVAASIPRAVAEAARAALEATA